MLTKEEKEIIYKVLHDERILDSPSFTDEEWDALCEYKSMTQEIFNSCLKKCHEENDGVMFCAIIDQFPQFNIKYEKEIINKHRETWKQKRDEYVKRFGTDYFFD